MAETPTVPAALKEAADDESLLSLCKDEGRVLLTNNVGDFDTIARTWQLQGMSHIGLIFTSDSSLPRSRHTIGRYVQLLSDLLASHPHDGTFTDRIQWL